MSVDIRLWLGTFHNQQFLAHQVSIAVSGVLVLTGFITFVVTGNGELGNFKDFDGARQRVTLAWSTAAVGLVSLMGNLAIYRWTRQLDRHDPSATDEQMAVRRMQAAIVGCLCLAALSIGLFVFFGALTRNGFVWPSIVVFFTASMAFVTCCYDAASVLRKGHIELNDATTVPLSYEGFDA